MLTVSHKIKLTVIVRQPVWHTLHLLPYNVFFCEFLSKTYPLAIIRVMTVRNCWASGITRGRGGDLFHDVIQEASNQHRQFSFLFLFEFLSETYPLLVLSIIWVMTALYCWASGITGGRGHLCPEMTLIRCTLNFDIQHEVSLKV